VIRFISRAVVAAALLAAPVLTLTGPALAADSSPSTATSTAGAQHAAVAAGETRKKKKHPPKTTPTTPPVSSSAFESQVVTLTNAQRVANGCRALRVDDRLVGAARAHSTDMVVRKFFSHTGSDDSDFVARAVRAGYTGASGENIAWGYRTPQAVVTGWMNSPGHRANILNCSSVATGVGVALESDGSPYWTQDFGRS